MAVAAVSLCAACNARGCSNRSATSDGASPTVVTAPNDSEASEAVADAPIAEPDGPVDDAESAAAEPASTSRRCPKDMVNVGNRFCIDRFEDTLVDDATAERLSPHYPPEPGMALRMFDRWQEQRLTLGPNEARSMLLPDLPDIERRGDFLPRAVSVRSTLPQGYINGRVAAEACGRAKKRLCTYDEWTFACRGEGQTKYPYGREYRAGVCNVFRMSHPAMKLHYNASIGHSDPRLGLVSDGEGPLLRVTGATKMCASRWGKDAIYDMVGNQDEWIDDPDGTFVGGFYSRSTKEGCDSIITVHPLLHWDYSIGFRCCS
jgi:hypothetical protein